MSMMKTLPLTIVAAALTLSCSTTPTTPTAQARSPKAQEELDRALAGLTAGTPLNCIPNYRSTEMQVIDDWTILFKTGGTVYVQNPRGGCTGIGNDRNFLATRLVGTSQLCSGDISQLIDSSGNFGAGSCVFSDFVPYTRTAG